MKTCLFVLWCLAQTAQGGAVKQDSPSLANQSSQQTAAKAFDDEGNVVLAPLVELKPGDLVRFMIKDKIVQGTVKQRIVDPGTSLKIMGDFPGHDKAGFVFQFGALDDGSTTVKGILFFAEQNELYSLELDDKTKSLRFKQQEIKVR
jgi:hypothetical protein